MRKQPDQEPGGKSHIYNIEESSHHDVAALRCSVLDLFGYGVEDGNLAKLNHPHCCWLPYLIFRVETEARNDYQDADDHILEVATAIVELCYLVRHESPIDSFNFIK